MRRTALALTALTLALALRLPVAADGIMLVQAGPFWMGRDAGAPEEAPLHSVFVRDVWIERHKVTNAEFAEFLNAHGRTAAGGERRIHRCAVGAPAQGSGARRSG